ncbi:Gp15 family bacteriophage protein [Lapidilactobacillus mulanensis]|uniref:Gp15 family bacteriophage protein n=1 Tax=Lapidilactobacillus mulanensis TaxID=2485999 RepID=A0ABW4DRV3_9LACO|nr:Gp15 family bacteriophage protein [Lapidilactobacillus mulanensis]
MFRLYEKLPSEVAVNDVEYRLNLDFDNVLLAFSALSDKEMTADDRLETYLRLLVIGKLPSVDYWIDLYDAIQEVLTVEQTSAVKYDVNGDPMPTKANDSKPDFDFDLDARYIYAAFLQAYGIDLIDQQGKMQWIKFVALLNALPEDTMFRQIRQIRSTDLSKIKDKEQRKQTKEQQKALALPSNVIEEEADDYGG